MDPFRWRQDAWRNNPLHRGGTFDPLPTWHRDPTAVYRNRQGVRGLLGTSAFGAALLGVAAVVLAVIAALAAGAQGVHFVISWLQQIAGF